MITSKITQKEYSDFIRNGLLDSFPKFKRGCNLNNDDIVTLEFPSEKRTISIWITTCNVETTIGFDNIDGVCCWHTHMSLFGANEPIEELDKAKEFLKKILDGYFPIFCNDTSKTYFVSDKLIDFSDEGFYNEGFVLRRWDEL